MVFGAVNALKGVAAERQVIGSQGLATAFEEAELHQEDMRMNSRYLSISRMSFEEPVDDFWVKETKGYDLSPYADELPLCEDRKHGPS